MDVSSKCYVTTLSPQPTSLYYRSSLSKFASTNGRWGEKRGRWFWQKSGGCLVRDYVGRDRVGIFKGCKVCPRPVSVRSSDVWTVKTVQSLELDNYERPAVFNPTGLPNSQPDCQGRWYLVPSLVVSSLYEGRGYIPRPLVCIAFPGARHLPSNSQPRELQMPSESSHPAGRQPTHPKARTIEENDTNVINIFVCISLPGNIQKFQTGDRHPCQDSVRGAERHIF